MDRGPLNYDGRGTIKRRICVENVPEVELLGILSSSSTYIYTKRTLIPTTGPFLYLLARQCRIKQLSFSTMAGVRACFN